ncbi:MAG: hypothetical protein K8Q99_04565 [Acholeplasmataceae bacterium]|nr:hypothetical protein [Acholeplasmataceae bacterium]
MKSAQLSLLKSILYLLISLAMISVVTYAWFTITNENNAHLISKVSGVEAEYQFYAYQNAYRLGSSNQTLVDNVCDLNDLEDLCYEEIKNPIYPKLIDGSVAPGERFSFAIAISSVGSMQGYVDLTLGNIESIGYDIESHKIQTAFGFEVTKISYMHDGIETLDKKEGLTYQSFTHFEQADGLYYPLVVDIPLVDNDDLLSKVIIYFDVYFDATVFSMDTEGIPYTNSNIFLNQVFNINDVYMNVTTQKASS